ncbi:MAG TPA: hypothetical protein VJ828_15965 [Lacipirellulaceae bacterium]|nr:hypothetical protein [Lacipirellulaceae bacterium]
MNAKLLRSIAVLAVVATSAIFTEGASAQCCGGATASYYQPTTAYYQPAAYTAYSPVAYQTYRTGWYPGYFLDRIRTRLWGSPSTYVASYPSPYVASYPSTYVASYPSTYAASYSSPYVASYAPSYSVGYTSQQVTMRPAYAPVYDPCSGCSTCGVSGVGQASYQSSDCASCGVAPSSGTTVIVPNGTVVTPGAQRSAPSEPQPELAPGEQVAPERTYQRPTSNGGQQEVQPEPGRDANEDELESLLEGDGAESSTYFEPPKLFDLNDRTARKSIAPVRRAIYQKRVTHSTISMPRSVSAERAQQDAEGWTSASN